ncbi:hypothetical protein KAR91_85540 [Candidatus Pacearchaeota archaeon]|nr:hypothetical protein [Candidatus Pacearchaeota archaeon]
MDGNKKSLGDLSTNFWKSEFRCPCKKCRRKKVLVDDLLLFKLEMIRMDLGNKPITITSGNRCPEENKIVGGWPNSAHIPRPKGKGSDVKVRGVKPINVGLAAEKVGGLRIGVAKWGCHLDTMPPNPSRFWIYLRGKIIYSAHIANKSLKKFYQIIKGR